jgi:hypothetical protein
MIADRQNNATHLMTAAEARGILRDMEAQVKSASRRRQQAAFFARNIAGKLSPEAVAIYAAYAAGKV